MRRVVYGGAVTAVLLAVAGSTRAGATSLSAGAAELACPAARVHTEPNERLGDLNGGPWIVASPRSAGIFAYLWGGEQQVDGRAAVYAGGVNPTTGTSEKVMWIVDRLRLGVLRIAGRRVRVTRTGRVRTARGSFRLELYEAYSEQTPGHLFPSIIAPPRAGCWRLTLRTPGSSARLIIRALAAPR
jgi:hypothetical protein